ncbi:hypothetical protein FB561_4048 [Kribbella amoyensis]|uniref:DUF2264 domain-containing protein n=1 Tax=Kribbella amoyensis TaxID=996641 RepID=A0A561BVX5_9ACTN|nr:DUF2264 domain-containing protein [Kribbella amoyensis]TWD82902.1 hypothetical protein FB561_4048 [Kribbella amoyensis]
MTVRKVGGSLRLPAPDRLLSARTGYTRETWLAVADHLLDSMMPWFSAGAAQVRLPGRGSWSGATCDGLEGFARSFLLAAFRIAADEGRGCEPLIERYARGLVAGADPDHPEAWPRLTPCSQQMVEAAAIAVALHESRAWLWDQLDPAEQQKVVDWLSGFVGSRTWDNNWRLFQVVGEQFLASVGAPYSKDDIEGGLERIEDWYVGDGWYTDGDGQNYDYYIGWAMHLYPALWTRMAAATPGTEYEDRLKVYRERLHRFLEDAVHLVGSDGAPVHHGRSLCYRMAAVAPYWTGALLDATPLAPGATRRLCSGVLRHFVDHGVPDGRGLLSLGWHHKFLPTTQPYSGPGSPYWASKGFLGLLLPADHPVWTDREAALPGDEGDQVRAMAAPGFLVHSTHHDGVVRLLNHGSDHASPGKPGEPEPAADPHYDRLAYSNHTAPEAAPIASRNRIDNHVAIVGADGTTSHRGSINRIGAGGSYASSWSHAWLPDRGPWRIETASVVHGAWEIRCVLVDGPGGVVIRHGGYALAAEQRPDAVTGGSGRPWAHVIRADGLASAVVGLHGYDGAAVWRDLDANAFGPHSATPYLVREVHPGGPLVLVSAVILSGDTVWPVAMAESVEVAVDGLRVDVEFADGAGAVVRLGAVADGPRCLVRTAGGQEEVVVDGGGNPAAAGETA